MTKLKQFAANIRREEWLAIILFIVVMSINIFVYNQQISLLEAFRAMVYYFTFGEPFYGLFFLVVYSLALFDFYKGLSEMFYAWIVKQRPPTREVFKDLFKKLLRPLRVIIPIALTTLPFYQLLSHFSYELRFVGKDIILATADQNLIGGLLFVYLPTQFTAIWISKLVYYAYLSLSIAISALLAWLFLLKKEMLFRLAVSAFIFSFVFSFPLFYVMPCQDPVHFFVQNDRGNIIPPSIATEMAGYQPSEFTKARITKIGLSEVRENRDNAVPVSCFPSMHAVWSLIVIYFLARISRWTILLSIPWLAVNLAGGLYYAQHYLVDYIVAIPIAMISIGAAYLLFKFKTKN